MSGDTDYPYRPAKRPRLDDAALRMHVDTQEEVIDDDDDWNEIYEETDIQGKQSPRGGSQRDVSMNEEESNIVQQENNKADSNVVLQQDSAVDSDIAQQHMITAHSDIDQQHIVESHNDIAQPHIAAADSDVADQHMTTPPNDVAHKPSITPRSNIGQQLNTHIDDDITQQPIAAADSSIDHQFITTTHNAVAQEHTTAADSSTVLPQTSAADSGANHGAEYQFDSSDGDADDSSDDSSSSEDDSDEDYPLLDPNTVAKMLMAGDGEDEDAGDTAGKTSGDYQPRTHNEVKPIIPPIRAINITPEMQTTVLGKIISIVESTILIQGYTSGEYQVLEPGSLLCTQDRKVVGDVNDTIGRVQQPLYSLLFDTEQEQLIQGLGLVVGSELWYVNSHSKFVFTEPLRGLKGTDASNLHDEEAGDDEVEFSDDEKEAESKRLKKLAKKGGRAGLPRQPFNERESAATRAPRVSTQQSDHGSSQGARPSGAYEGGGLNYDDPVINDGTINDGPYKKLSRPDNFLELMAQVPRGDAFRGRGRGATGHRGGRGGRHPAPPPPPPAPPGAHVNPAFFGPYAPPGWTPQQVTYQQPPVYYPPQANRPPHQQYPQWSGYLQQQSQPQVAVQQQQYNQQYWQTQQWTAPQAGQPSAANVPPTYYYYYPPQGPSQQPPQ